jgi:hypothetical protein
MRIAPNPNPRTYRQLANFLATLNEEQLEADITVEDADGEFRPAQIVVNSGDDVLDDGHPYFTGRE